MKNLEFHNPLVNSEVVQLGAKLSSSIASLIRETTNCPKDRLENYLSKEDVFSYEIQATDGLDIMQLQNTIETIANSFDEETFVQHILKNDGKAMMPVDMHKMMQEEFNLEGDIEWYTALFFVSLGGLLSFPEFCYRSIEEDMEADDCVVFIATVEKKYKK